MGIPLQPINLAPYANLGDPLQRGLALGSALQNIRTQQARRPLMTAQSALAQDQAALAEQKLDFLRQHPEALAGPPGQMMAALQMGLGGQPNVTDGTSGSSTFSPFSAAPTTAAPQGASAAAPTPAAAPGTPPTTDFNALAQNKINEIMKDLKPRSAADLGFRYHNPQQQALADAMVQRFMPKTYAQIRGASVPLQMYSHMPADVKNQQIALLSNYMDRQTANKYLAAGGSLYDLAKAANIPYSTLASIAAKYPPTHGVLDRDQRQGWANAIFQGVNPTTTKWLAPYVGALAGLSPAMVQAQVRDRIFSAAGSHGNKFKAAKNQDQIAKAIAAAAMRMELAGTRIQGVGLRSNRNLISQCYVRFP